VEEVTPPMLTAGKLPSRTARMLEDCPRVQELGNTPRSRRFYPAARIPAP